MKNIIILANIEWNFLKQRHQFLAEQLVKHGYNVVFVESAAKRNPKLKDVPRILDRLKKNLKKQSLSANSSEKKSVTKNLNIVSPFVLPSTFGAFRILNKLFFLPKLGSKIKKYLTTDEVKVIWYAPTATTRELVNILKPQRTVYDCVSNFEAFKDMPSDTMEMENKLILETSAVVADCDFLYNKHKQKATEMCLIEPVVDFDLYNKPFGNIRITSIKRIVYFGLITPHKIDVGLLDFLSKNGYEVHVIGRIDGNVSAPENVIFHNVVPAHQLPNMLKAYDALILPYLINDHTNGVIPAKFFECFATGLPIIATQLYNFERYKEYLISADSYEGFLKELKHFVGDDYSQERQMIARDHSLEAFVNKFIDVLES